VPNAVLWGILAGLMRFVPCKRNIEMTPPSKVQMALFRFLGLRKEVSNDGGVDERTGVFTA
jgi:hypothetical protein